MFLYLFGQGDTYTRLSTNTTVIQPGNKTATVPLASPRVFPRTLQHTVSTYMHNNPATCVCVCVCVRERERERERGVACVCVCVP